MSGDQMVLGYSPYGAPRELLPLFDDLFTYERNLKQVDNLKGVDAVILWGGEDISPSLYGEKPIMYSGPAEPTERDLFEWEILRQALVSKIPVIGICRGAQLMCAFAGGKLIQDCTNHKHNAHTIKTVDSGSFFNIPADHHQMMYPYEVDHELLGWAEYNLSGHYHGGPDLNQKMRDKAHLEPEVVYFPEINGLAIQPHPEWMSKNTKFKGDFLDWCTDMVIKKLF